jgi:type 1 fimbriae regulatory protein FimB
VEKLLEAANGTRCHDDPLAYRSEQGGPMTVAAFLRIVRSAEVEAKFSFQVHSHMLRHACDFYLANKGFDTLGPYRST